MSDHVNESQLYAHLLWTCGHGYPVWVPEPNENLPTAYKDDGVKVGDVGLITSSGLFDFLFNPCNPPGHVTHVDWLGVPRNFQVLLWDSRISQSATRNYHHSSKPVCAGSTNIVEIEAGASAAVVPGAPVSAGGRFGVKFAKEEGALLVLPNGGHRFDALHTKPFLEYARAHLTEWYDFVKEKRDSEDEQSLFFVTGVDKSSSWEMGLVKEKSSNQQYALLLDVVGVAGGQLKLSRLSNPNPTVRTRYSPDGNHKENQAVFLRGYRISFRERTRDPGEIVFGMVSTYGASKKDIFEYRHGRGGSRSSHGGTFSRGSGPGASSSNGGPDSKTSRSASTPSEDSASSEGLHNSDEDLSDSGSTANTDAGSRAESTPEEEDEAENSSKLLKHPSLIMNHFILKTRSEADVAITHENDWISLLRDEDFDMPDEQTLIERFENQFQIVVVDGCAFSELKTASLFMNNITREGDYAIRVGGFADIWKGHADDRPICLKVFRMQTENEEKKIVQNFCHEALLWRRLDHPNVLPFLGINVQLFAPGICLVSPWMQNGDIVSYLETHPNHDRITSIYEISKGLAYLHSLGIVHGDIKGANILVDDQLHCCLADFGLSTTTGSPLFSSSIDNSTMRGSLRWMPPESLSNNANSSNPTSKDVYSFGCTILEVISGQVPFSGIKDPTVILKVINGERPIVPTNCPSALQSLIEQCWAQDPARRPSSETAQVLLEDLVTLQRLEKFGNDLPDDADPSIASQVPLISISLDSSSSSDIFPAIGKSAAHIVAEFAVAPQLRTSVEILCEILNLCENMPTNRHQASQLGSRCHTLLVVARETERLAHKPSGYTLMYDLNDIQDRLTNIRERMRGWAVVSRVEAVVRQRDMINDIEDCLQSVSDCLSTFQTPSLTEADLWREELEKNRKLDHGELLDYLSDIVSGQKLYESAHSPTNLIEMTKQPLGSATGVRRDSDDLSRSHGFRSEIDPLVLKLSLNAGEVIKLGQFPVSGTATTDIYEGLYLQRDKVAIKVVRAINSDQNSIRRFMREAKIWSQVWSVDQGKHILPFWGFCMDDGPFPYIVSPWQANGNVLDYIKRNDEVVDYHKMIVNIAQGLQVLHSMAPPIVHGELKAANIVIDDSGNPLIADFGLSKVIEDITGIPFTQSRGLADSYRWFAPEVCVGSLSLHSDIYALAMTILELLTHQQPYSNIKHTTEVVIRIAQGIMPPRPSDKQVLERGLDDELWTLMTACWNTEPSARPSIDDVLTRLNDTSADCNPSLVWEPGD